jgi:AraC-like DNA-binding protein
MPGNLRGAAPSGFQNPAVGPTFRPLFRGETVEVFDWRCPGCDTGGGSPEQLDAYEIVFVRRGTFVREVNGAARLITAGTLTFAAAGEAHRYRHPVPGGDRCSVFRGSVATVKEILGDLDPAQRDGDRPRFPLSDVPVEGDAYLLHRLILRAAVTGADPVEWEERALLFLQRTLRSAFARLGRGGRTRPAAVGPPGRAMDVVAAVEELLARQFASRLTLPDIGRAVGRSPFHLSRTVRAATGLPIHRLLLRHRLRAALERVLDSREHLSAIAYATGFSSHSHLSDSFRREYGCSPSAVRRGHPFRPL